MNEPSDGKTRRLRLGMVGVGMVGGVAGGPVHRIAVRIDGGYVSATAFAPHQFNGTWIEMVQHRVV